MQNQFSRTQLLLGKPAIDTLMVVVSLSSVLEVLVDML